MKLEELLSEIEKELPLTHDFTSESIKSTDLYIKFQKIYTAERIVTKKMELDHNKFRLDLIELFSGKITDNNDPVQIAWKERTGDFWHRICDRKTAEERADVDEELVRLAMKVTIQREKLRVLEETLKHIAGRTWQIGRAIDWHKFKNGIG